MGGIADPGKPSQADPQAAPPPGDDSARMETTAPPPAPGGDSASGPTQTPPPPGSASGLTQTPPPPGSGSGRAQAPPPPRRAGRGSSVGGWILASLGALFVVAAIVLAVVHLTQRGKDGYYTSDTAAVASPGYAVTSENFDLGDLPSFATDAVGRVRITARSRNGQPLFVGIGPRSAVNGYLGGVARNVVTDFNGSTVDSTGHAGTAPSGPPSTKTFWEASGSGRGQINATWKVKGGDWAAVVMNASAAPHVNAAVSLGAKTNLLLWIALGFLVLGVIAGGAGGALLWSRR